MIEDSNNCHNDEHKVKDQFIINQLLKTDPPFLLSRTCVFRIACIRHTLEKREGEGEK